MKTLTLGSNELVIWPDSLCGNWASYPLTNGLGIRNPIIPNATEKRVAITFTLYDTYAILDLVVTDDPLLEDLPNGIVYLPAGSQYELRIYAGIDYTDPAALLLMRDTAYVT